MTPDDFAIRLNLCPFSHTPSIRVRILEPLPLNVTYLQLLILALHLQPRQYVNILKPFELVA
jgi:hypothetical protein